MHALTLDALSGGRLTLGLGVSGPQVVEGWYGVPFGRPLARTREYVQIMRDVWRRAEPVTSAGPHYPLPLPPGGEGVTGLGKPLKSIAHPVRPDIPVYLGAEGPKNVALSTEIAQGWLPLFVDPQQIEPIFGESLRGRPADFEIAASVPTIVTDDLRGALELAKIPLAFYIGGMGARDRNFHLDLIGRLGYAEEAAAVQELFLAGRRDEAIRAVPDELADATALLGPLGPDQGAPAALAELPGHHPAHRRGQGRADAEGSARPRPRLTHQALYMDHDNTSPLGAILLFDESAQVVWITGEQDDRTGHVHGRHRHDRVNRATMT